MCFYVFYCVLSRRFGLDKCGKITLPLKTLSLPLNINNYLKPCKKSTVARNQPWRRRLQETIYESNTIGGKIFDVSLLVLIFASILVVMLDSIQSLNEKYGHIFYILEWIFTIIFTIEYILRLISISRPRR